MKKNYFAFSRVFYVTVCGIKHTLKLAALGFVLSFTTTAVDAQNCPVATIPGIVPGNIDLCGAGEVSFTATPGIPANTVLWLDTGNRIISNSNVLTTNVSTSGVSFTAVESSLDATSGNVGPLGPFFTSVYPTSNFTNGQFFTAISYARIDSLDLRVNGNVSGFINIWSNSPAQGGYLITRAPFSVTAASDAVIKIPVGLYVSPGSYFMNFSQTGGTGIMFRSTGQAVYPYTLPGVLSITGTDGAATRYYYFFNWKVTQVCTGTPSAQATVTFTSSGIAETLPYLEDFESGLPCDWIRSQVAATGWLGGDSTALSSAGFLIPGGSSFVASNDDACNCDASATELVSPAFDFTNYTAANQITLSFDAFHTITNGSTVEVKVRAGSGAYSSLGFIPASSTWTLNTLDLSAFAGQDSVTVTFVHNDNAGNGSGIAIDNFALSTTCVGISLDLYLRTDIYGSEIQWAILDAITEDIIAQGGPYPDVSPYNPVTATHTASFCIVPGTQLVFYMIDAYGDGMFDGTNTGFYSLVSGCGDTILTGSAPFTYGGMPPLPNFAYDSVAFTAVPSQVDLGPDQTIFNTQSIVLDAGPKGPYLWSTGATTQTINVDGVALGVGVYPYSVITGENVCSSFDSVVITVEDAPYTDIIITVVTDIYGSEISWALIDTLTGDTVISAGPYTDIQPYNIALATHIDTVNVPKGKMLEFRVTDSYGDGLFDGTNFGYARVATECQPELFFSSGEDFPYGGPPNVNPSYDTIIFASGAAPNIMLGPDVTICANDSVMLDAGSTNGVTWSTGSTDRHITIKGSQLLVGSNIISVATDLGECYAIDEIVITVVENPVANFTHNINQATVSFVGTSVSGATYHWDFGDGTSSTSRTTSHTYTQSGTYQVVFTVSNAGGCIGTKTVSIVIVIGAIEHSNNIQSVSVYPNPSDGRFTLDFELLSKDNITLQVLDIRGQLLLEKELQPGLKDKVGLDLNYLSPGIYILQAKGVHTTFNQRITVVE